MTTMTDSLPEVLESLRAAQRDFQERSAGRTLCEVGKLGNASRDLKQAEGRMIVLQELERALRKAHPGLSGRDVIESLLARWQDLPALSEAWQVYRQAGLDELRRRLERA